jgi:hypothetical protein
MAHIYWGGFIGGVIADVWADTIGILINSPPSYTPPTSVNAEEVTRPEGVPGDWIEQDSQKGGGKIYINPENNWDRIRVMPGNPNSPNPAQQGPYVIDQLNGGFLTADGTRVQGGDRPEVHIPLRDYDFGRSGR